MADDDLIWRFTIPQGHVLKQTIKSYPVTTRIIWDLDSEYITMRAACGVAKSNTTKKSDKSDIQVMDDLKKIIYRIDVRKLLDFKLNVDTHQVVFWSKYIRQCTLTKENPICFELRKGKNISMCIYPEMSISMIYLENSIPSFFEEPVIDKRISCRFTAKDFKVPITRANGNLKVDAESIQIRSNEQLDSLDISLMSKGGKRSISAENMFTYGKHERIDDFIIQKALIKYFKALITVTVSGSTVFLYKSSEYIVLELAVSLWMNVSIYIDNVSSSSSSSSGDSSDDDTIVSAEDDDSDDSADSDTYIVSKGRSGKKDRKAKHSDSEEDQSEEEQQSKKRSGKSKAKSKSKSKDQSESEDQSEKQSRKHSRKSKAKSKSKSKDQSDSEEDQSRKPSKKSNSKAKSKSKSKSKSKDQSESEEDQSEEERSKKRSKAKSKSKSKSKDQSDLDTIGSESETEVTKKKHRKSKSKASSK